MKQYKPVALLHVGLFLTKSSIMVWKMLYCFSKRCVLILHWKFAKIVSDINVNAKKPLVWECITKCRDIKKFGLSFVTQLVTRQANHCYVYIFNIFSATFNIGEVKDIFRPLGLAFRTRSTFIQNQEVHFTPPRRHSTLTFYLWQRSLSKTQFHRHVHSRDKKLFTVNSCYICPLENPKTFAPDFNNIANVGNEKT